jgi:hypothetical protein
MKRGFVGSLAARIEERERFLRVAADLRQQARVAADPAPLLELASRFEDLAEELARYIAKRTRVTDRAN